MAEALQQFWLLVRGANLLDPDAFRAIARQPNGVLLIAILLLCVGISQSFGQAIVLFLNQVKPLRFLLSLGIAGLLFFISTAFWMLSVWVASRLLYGVDASFLTVFRVLGLAYAPLLWSFLVALPYFGVPLGVVLSVWSLLAFVRGFSAVTELGRWQVLGCAFLGWFIFQVGQRTIGRPAVTLGRLLANVAAGTPLITDLAALERVMQTGFSNFTGGPNRRESS